VHYNEARGVTSHLLRVMAGALWRREWGRWFESRTESWLVLQHDGACDARTAAEKEKRKAEHKALAKAHAAKASKEKAAKDKAAAAVVPQLPAGPKVLMPEHRCYLL